MGVLRIRRAAESDWPEIWPIWREIVEAGDTYAYPLGLDSETARREWFGEAPDEVWLAEAQALGDQGIASSTDDASAAPVVEPVVVGTYHLGPNRPGAGSHIANASYMVDGNTRGIGVGRAMVEHSIERATACGYRGIQFNAVAETNVYAVRLYQDLGFSVIGRVPGGFRHPEQGFVDLLIMFRPL